MHHTNPGGQPVSSCHLNLLFILTAKAFLGKLVRFYFSFFVCRSETIMHELSFFFSFFFLLFSFSIAGFSNKIQVWSSTLLDNLICILVSCFCNMGLSDSERSVHMILPVELERPIFFDNGPGFHHRLIAVWQ